MLAEIVLQTPPWVYAIFVALLWFGSSQLLPRRVTLRRITLLPLAMSGLSLYGVVSAFGTTPMALACWMLALLLTLIIVSGRSLPAGTRYHPTERSFDLPGSAVPLALMMGIFVTKYAVGVLDARAPQLLHAEGVAESVSLLYGLFSALFLARSFSLWRLALATTRAAEAATHHSL